MAFISLTANEKYNPYRDSNITKQDYDYSKFFYKYHHEPIKHLNPRWVRIYYDYYRNWYDHLQYYFAGFSNDPYVVLRVNSNQRYTFVSADVYFNKYHNEPLLVTLKSHQSTRYYPRSQFDSDIKGYKTKRIDTLFPLTAEKTLLPILIKENDEIDKILTYQVDMRGTSEYNGKKIRLTRFTFYSDTETHFKHLVEKLQPNGLFCLRHEPYYRYHSLNSYFLFKSHMLVDKDNKIIDEIQGRKYNVMVYWSERVKEPLLLELNEGGHTYSNDLFNIYLIIKKGKDGLYFERLHNSTKEIMELAISKYGQMYEILSHNKYEIMITLLKRLECNFIYKIYSLLNKRTHYTEIDVQNSLTNLVELASHSDKCKISSLQPNIKVLRGSDCSKLSPDFEYYQHEIDIKSTPASNFTENSDTIILTFLAPKITNTQKFVEIILYDRDTTDKNREQIYYQYYVPQNIKLTVFFHRHKYNIPVLFCFNGAVYAPNTKDSYNKWVRVDVVDSCSCLDYARILYRLEQLSRSILEIVPTRQGQKAVVTKGEKKGPDLPQVKDHRLTEPVSVPKSTSITPPHVVQLSQGQGSKSTVEHDISKGAPPPVHEKTPIKRTEITATSEEKETRQEIPYDPRSTRSDTIPGTSISSNVSGSDSTRGGKTLLNGPESHLIVEDTGDLGAEEQETISRVDTTHGHPSGSTVLDTGVHNGTTEDMPTIESNIEDHRGTDHTRISGDGDLRSNAHLQDETSQVSLTDNGHSAHQASYQDASPNRKDDESSGSLSPGLIGGIVVTLLVVKGVTIGLLLAKFPYIIFPSIKALI